MEEKARFAQTCLSCLQESLPLASSQPATSVGEGKYERDSQFHETLGGGILVLSHLEFICSLS